MCGKKSKEEIASFSLSLAQNIYELHLSLKSKTYRHGSYQHFRISDPKPRDIHKASVRDRLLHRAVYRILYPFFDKRFIVDSFSCRNGKGTYRAMNRFRACAYKASRNHTRTCWVLKCVIRKFFASIDHITLKDILHKWIADEDILALLSDIIGSFHSFSHSHEYTNVGLPLGNLTSQLLVNIYMNEFDQFVKQELKVQYYIRYADDFIFLSHDKHYLQQLLSHIQEFLLDRLKLSLHPEKVFIKTLTSGVDFLGWVHFPNHRVLRTATKRRMFKRVNERNKKSYLGLCEHGNAYRLTKKLC